MVHIVVGSMLGASEYVADAIAELLNKQNISHRIHLQPDITDLPDSGHWLIITSTHGAGDLPDNIQAFAQQLKRQSYPNVAYWVIALGDSSYDTFCEGGKTMHKLMQQTGAQPLHAPHLVDVLQHTIPEENAVAWFSSIYQDALGEQH
ncbi:MAG: flavodoxin domain-containing protein [Aestuariibacter sp.]